MHDKMYPLPSKEFSQRRRELTPEVDKAFHDFSNAAFADGALPRKDTAPAETMALGRYRPTPTLKAR